MPTMQEKETMGERIRQRRLALGMTQTELGMKIGCRKRRNACMTISKLETGNASNPRLDRLLRLAEKLEVPLEYLIYGA